MMDHTEDADLRLNRLRDLTDSIEPRPHFTDSVMARLDRDRSGWLRRVPTLWIRALPVAALLAVMSAIWAYSNAREFDHWLVGGTDSEEVAEMDAL